MKVRKLKVLIIGKDPSLLPSQNENYIGDSLKRHILYARTLRQQNPNSEIRIITYSKKNQPKLSTPCDGLTIYGTNSKHRALYILNVCIHLTKFLFERWKPDLITVQTPWEEGLLGLIFSKIFHIKFLSQLHFDLFSADWKKESFLNPIRQKIAFLVLKNANKIRVVSEPLKRNLIQALKIPQDRVIVAPVGVNFIQTESSQEVCRHNTFEKNLISSDTKIILFVGRLVPSKNLSLFVDIARKIDSVMPNVKYVIVGKGPEEEMIRKKISQSNLENNFIFLGHVPHHNIPTIYTASDLFLLTSHHEGFGRVVLEAMLSGIPVISTKCTGPEELIDHEKTGFLFSEDNPTALANAAINLLKSSEKRQEIGTAARKKVELRYSSILLANKIINTWLNV